MSARAVARRSAPASCCRWASARRIETMPFKRARVASCWFIAARDSIVMNAERVTNSMTTQAITVRDRIRLKPGFFFEVFMPESLTRSIGIYT